jgi:hypothetical protein
LDLKEEGNGSTHQQSGGGLVGYTTLDSQILKEIPKIDERRLPQLSR